MDNKNQQRINQINCMTFPQLKAEARRLKVRGRAGKNRADLRQMIIDQEIGREGMAFEIIGERIDDRVRAINDMKLAELKRLARAYEIKGRGKLKACHLQNRILLHINDLLDQAVGGPAPPTARKRAKKAKPVEEEAVPSEEKKTPEKKKTLEKKKTPAKKKDEKKTTESEAEKFLEETEEVKKTVSPEEALKKRFAKSFPNLVLGFNAEQEADLGDMLLAVGGQEALDRPAVFLGNDVKDIPTDEGDFKIRLVKGDKLPDLGTFGLVVVAPIKRGQSTFTCDMLKKYTQSGGYLLMDLDTLKGCKSFKSKLIPDGDPLEEFEGYQLFRLP